MYPKMSAVLIYTSAQFCARMTVLLRAACLMAVVLLPLKASAATVTVDCDNPPSPGTFSSISAALNSLPLDSTTEPHMITVTGTCIEHVFLLDRQRITITAPPGQLATIVAADPTRVIVNIGRSRSILLRNLVIRGGRSGVFIDDSSEADVQDCTVQENSFAGIQVSDHSNLRANNLTIHNNSGQGLFVDDASFATLAEGPPGVFLTITENGGPGLNITASTVAIRGLTRIGDNGGSGIAASGSVLLIAGFTTIENNRGTGLSITGGRAVINGVQAENIIRGNGFGVSITGATVTFNGQNTIQNNEGVGVSIGGGFVSFNTIRLPDGTQRVNTIEGHILGLNVAAAASASFVGPNRIRGNGHPNATGMFRGGIRIGTVSRIQLDGGNEITDNIGHGLFADFNGALSVTGALVANNTEGGVRVGRLSVGSFGTGSTFQGNGGSNISCDTTSLIFGELAGIPNINCRNIERELGPPRPGAVHDLPPQ